jgi:hypothetical protein
MRLNSSSQEGMTHIFNALPLETLTPRGAVKLGFDVMQQSAAICRLFVPWPESHRVLQEFQNKLEAYTLFAHVDSTLGIPPDAEVRLPELIRRIEAWSPYRAVWATEGLGYYLVNMLCGQGKDLQTLLHGEHSCELPERSLVPLHSGMGLAIATRLLQTINSRSTESEIRRTVDQFVMVCRDNSLTGYAGAAYESLGLVTRNLYPQLVRRLDEELRKIDEDLAAYFWHGVGRGIYFAPTNFLPGDNSWRALKQTSQEPPHESGKRNALAGLAWAMTLVNIRHPEILASFVEHHHSEFGDRAAFVNGVSSASMIWRDSTADDPSLKAFCNYQPGSSDKSPVKEWDQMVRRPCMEALEDVYPALKSRGGLGEVFRCHDPMAG